MQRAHLLITLGVVLVVIAVVSIFAFVNLNPQPNRPISSSGLSVEWQRILPGISGTCIIETSDGGYLAIGTTATVKRDTDRDLAYFADQQSILIKTDGSGNMQWQKAFQVEGLTASLSSVIETKDGGYLVGGGITSSQQVTPRSKFCLIKLDEQGKVNWTKTYNGVDAGINDALTILQNNGDGYVCFGDWSNDWDYHGFLQGFLLKTDANGILLYNTTVGVGPASTMVPTGDGYVFLSREQATGGGDKYLLAKTDLNGKLLWRKDYGGGDTSYQTCGAPASDGGYLIGGSVSGKGGWLVKTDCEGQMVWNRTYPGVGEITSIAVTDSGGFVLSARTNANGGAAWIAKIDSLGNIESELATGHIDEKDHYSSVSDVIFTSDGGYLCIGTWDQTYEASNAQHIWIIKIKPDDTTS